MLSGRVVGCVLSRLFAEGYLNTLFSESMNPPTQETPELSSNIRSITGRTARVFLGFVSACLLAGTDLQAQPAPSPNPDSLSDMHGFVHFPMLGGVAEDRLRISQILGDSPATGFLVRSPSTLLPTETSGTGITWRVVTPQVHGVYNSAIPFSLNEGSLWGGRGVNVEISAGVTLRAGPVTAIVMPSFTSSENEEFQTLPYPAAYLPKRSNYAAPWYPSGESIDRPSRFGEDPIRGITLGQSSLTLDLGSIALGTSTENLWWGPGIRNALVMSNNAPGIPQVFLRTDRPLRTFAGSVEGRWMIGALSRSDYFDVVPQGHRRSISAIALTLQPAFEPNLILGATRSVYAPFRKKREWFLDSFNVFRGVGRPAVRLAEMADNEPTMDAPYPVVGPDQIFALFGRWIFPEAGVEIYGEWGRTERPDDIRDAVVSPHHTQGWTGGFQWARPIRSDAVFRLQAEATNLELSSTFNRRPVLAWYTSASVPEGYTNAGRVIGAGIGPGSSSQWLAADIMGSGWQAGVFAGRIRWDNGAYYRRAPLRTHHGHDVSVMGGMRAGGTIGPVGVMAELQSATRINYLFQHYPYAPEITSVDIRNHTLRITFSAAEDFR